MHVAPEASAQSFGAKSSTISRISKILTADNITSKDCADDAASGGKSTNLRCRTLPPNVFQSLAEQFLEPYEVPI